MGDGSLTRARPVLSAVVAILVARTAVNGGFRIVYPFLPEIARGLGVGLGAMGVLLFLRSLTGLAAPVLPTVIARLGHRRVMLVGIAGTLAGSAALIATGGLAGSDGEVAGGLAGAAVGFVLLGAAKPLFDVPALAWLSARVPVGRQGRTLGATEVTWAGGLALAFPAGWVIARAGWAAMFWLVAGVSVAGLVAVLVLIARDQPNRGGSGERPRLPWRGPLAALLLVVVLFRLAAELLFVVYGSWLESDFGMAVSAIGAFTLIVVAAELGGEGAVSAFADRVGLRRTVLLGLAGTTVVYAGLGLVKQSLVAAVVAVVGWFVLFEVTIVATMPLAATLAGAGRERLLSLVVTVGVAATAVAALAAPPLFAVGGIALCGAVAAACTGVAFVIAWRSVPAVAPSS